MKLSHLFTLCLGLTLGLASANETTYTGSYWANGVSEAGGWYDINKLDNSDGDADDNLCYAASATNIIAWWQNETLGSMLTSEAPKSLDDIWQTFIDANQEWESGGETLSAINWWISGVYCPENREDTDAWERHYTKVEDWPENEDLIPVTLREFEGYYYDQYNLDQGKLSDFLVDLQMTGATVTQLDYADLLENAGCITLAIMAQTTGDGEVAAGHAITMWGVEYDEEGKMSAIWITDSDDEIDGLVKISVTVDETNDKIWLGDEYFATGRYYLDVAYVIDVRESYKWSELTMKTYVTEQVNPFTYNGRAGVALLPEIIMNEKNEEDDEDAEEDETESVAVVALESEEEEVEEEGEEEEAEVSGALASIIEAVDSGEMNDRAAAAVAGASTAVLGQALSDDMGRQLRAIRNRAAMGQGSRDAVTLDGKGGSPVQAGKFFVWANAEGNRAEQESDGSAAGYTLSSWGGTVGAGMELNNQLTLGLALTAMYGDLKSEGPDSLDGDMDTAYLSAFARYQCGPWSHSFIGAVGAMEADYRRTAMNYTNNGDTDGTAFGLMYELSRGYALSDWSHISPVLNIASRHTAVDGYCESGTDAALNVGKQTLDTVTMALGARYAAVVGRQTLNRDCALEARALVKYDFGDTQSNASVGFMGYATRACIESAERGALGLELGAGISVPVGPGSIFTDGAVELRCDYTNLNAAVGYKIQF